jgi:hypothetical protein
LISLVNVRLFGRHSEKCAGRPARRSLGRQFGWIWAAYGGLLASITGPRTAIAIAIASWSQARCCCADTTARQSGSENWR